LANIWLVQEREKKVFNYDNSWPFYLLFLLWLAGIAEASARGAGEAGLAAGAQDQGDEQPRLKVIEFQ
jgi:hypothetical protein